MQIYRTFFYLYHPDLYYILNVTGVFLFFSFICNISGLHFSTVKKSYNFA